MSNRPPSTLDAVPSGPIDLGAPAATDVEWAADTGLLDFDADDADPIERVRDRLGLGDGVADITIAASLAQIAGKIDARSRWLAAFGSPLGKVLASRGGDLNAALDVLLAHAPRQQS